MITRLIELLNDKRVRYLIIGGSSATIEYVSFILLNITTSNVIIANIISFTVGLMYSFSLHRIWTFKGEHRHNPKSQLIAYVTLAILNVILTSILIEIQVGYLHVPAFIAKLVCMALVVVWNYLLLSKLIFRIKAQ